MIRFERSCDGTAYHESGHAVVAKHLGAQVYRVKLERKQQGTSGNWSDWDGFTNMDCTPIGLPEKRIVALAGPLAEAKYLTQKTVGGKVTFKPGWLVNLAKVIGSWTGGNMHVTLEFVAADGASSEQCELTIFEGDLVQLDGPNESEIETTLVNLAGYLDSPTLWLAIERVADNLLKQLPKPIIVERLEMSERYVNGVIDEVLSPISEDDRQKTV